MPLYFAYGANLDPAAMSTRCPASRAIGTGCLTDHRFFIMPEGYASVRCEPGAEVHGLLWDLADADGPALDLFEEVAHGLYVKAARPVRRAGLTNEALIYLGHTEKVGRPQPGYMEAVLAAAAACALPDAYLAELAGWRHPAALTGIRRS